MRVLRIFENLRFPSRPLPAPSPPPPPVLSPTLSPFAIAWQQSCLLTPSCLRSSHLPVTRPHRISHFAHPSPPCAPPYSLSADTFLPLRSPLVPLRSSVFTHPSLSHPHPFPLRSSIPHSLTPPCPHPSSPLQHPPFVPLPYPHPPVPIPHFLYLCSPSLLFPPLPSEFHFPHCTHPIPLHSSHPPALIPHSSTHEAPCVLRSLI
ncbi:unnamed protein product [Closterium sp. Naga37s-1]|nr:unnamed protein product [Closterium sp. Naga37s-1]